MIEFCQVTAGYGGAPILENVTFTVPRGSITTVIGPNGCGKTTLLRAAARQLVLDSGSIRIAGQDIRSYDRKSFARTAAFLPQVRDVPGISVEMLVSHGRFPHLGLSRKMTARDKAAVRDAMEMSGVLDWAGRDLRTLSGGERQRVYIAMALAQQTDVIFLDEPTTYLDLGHQFDLMELITLLVEQGKTVLMVLHDLSHALRYSGQIILLEHGKVRACGTPEAVAESGEIDRVFGIRTRHGPDGYSFLPRTEHAP